VTPVARDVTGAGDVDRFRSAARAYLAYGIVYWLGGFWLALYGVGVRSGGGLMWRGVAWLLVGLVLVVVIPFLLRRPRPAFERWILTRTDFARILAAFMAFRAYKVGAIALSGDGGSVPAPWGGKISFQAGAAVFFLVTVVALVYVARAAWAKPDVERAR
jgi:hypothetical protein